MLPGQHNKPINCDENIECTRKCFCSHYTTLHYTTLHYTTLHYTTLHYTTLHYTTLHYTTLHYTTLHYTTLHYTTLHYTICHHPQEVLLAQFSLYVHKGGLKPDSFHFIFIYTICIDILIRKYFGLICHTRKQNNRHYHDCVNIFLIH